LALPVKAGNLTRVYAVGEPVSKTMKVAVATLELSSTGTGRPGEVNTGTGGQAAGMTRSRPSVVPLFVLVVAGALALSVGRAARP